MNPEKYLKRIKLNKANHLLLESMLRYERAFENYRSARRQEEAVHKQYWETLKQQLRKLSDDQPDFAHLGGLKDEVSDLQRQNDASKQLHEPSEQRLDDPRAIAEKKIDLYKRLMERINARNAEYASSRAEREKTLAPLEVMVAGAKEEFQNASKIFTNTYSHLKSQGLLNKHDERIREYVIVLTLSPLEDNARDTMMAVTEIMGCAHQTIDKVIRRHKEGDEKTLPDPPRSPS